MKKSKLNKIVHLLVIVGYFTAHAVAFGGVVLCQGSDGHIAIEFINVGHCSEIPFEESDGHNHFDDSDHLLIPCELHHCGDCEDFPLTFISGKENVQKMNSTNSPISNRAPPPPYSINFCQYRQSQILPPPNPFHNIYPAFLRTTVLLI